MNDNQKNIVKIILLFLGAAVIILLVWLALFQKPIEIPAAAIPQKPEDSEINIPEAAETAKEDSSKTIPEDVPRFREAEKANSYILQYSNSTKDAGR